MQEIINTLASKVGLNQQQAQQDLWRIAYRPQTDHALNPSFNH